MILSGCKLYFEFLFYIIIYSFFLSDILFKSLLPCNNVKFNPTRLEYIPALLLYSIGRLSGITNEVLMFNKVSVHINNFNLNLVGVSKQYSN